MSGTDSETGEFVTYSTYPAMEIHDYDMETGEPETDNCTIKLRKTRFNVPKNLLTPVEPKPKCCIDNNEIYTLTRREQVMTFQEEIISGYNKTSHRLFFLIITSLTLFTRFVVLGGILLEFGMHAWAHRRNSRNSNPTIYFRSPLHIFTSHFCICCRHETAMNQVIKMQNQRHRNWQLNLKDMTRTLY